MNGLGNNVMASLGQVNQYFGVVLDTAKANEKSLQIAGAVVTGVCGVLWLTKKYVQRAWYTKTNRIDGRIVIITGCNTGLGKAAAIEIAKRGAKLYLACRDMAKCEEVRKEIIKLSSNPSVYARELDLGSLESIRKFSERFHKEENRLDILMNNAGIFMVPQSKTKDGFEQVMGVNHLGHFLLTNLLLDLLKKSAPSRIVVLSSSGHESGVINKDDWMLEKSYSKLQAYCNSKLANNLFTIHLDQLLAGSRVTVNAVHPGGVQTDIFRHVNVFVRYTFGILFNCFIKSVESGAQTQIMVALDPDLEQVSGKYFVDCAEAVPAKQAMDFEMAKWLWNKSVELTGLKNV